MTPTELESWLRRTHDDNYIANAASEDRGIYLSFLALFRTIERWHKRAIQLEAEVERLQAENARLNAALNANICPECEAIDEEDAWPEEAEGGKSDKKKGTKNDC